MDFWTIVMFLWFVAMRGEKYAAVWSLWITWAKASFAARLGWNQGELSQGVRHAHLNLRSLICAADWKHV